MISWRSSAAEVAIEDAHRGARVEHERRLCEALAGTGATVLVGRHGVTLALPPITVEQARAIAAVLGQSTARPTQKP